MGSIFKSGDLVRISDDLGPSMRHFKAGVQAIVDSSYAEQFGGSDTDSYSLYLRGIGRVSWYYGSQLKLIERGRNDLREAWGRELKDEMARCADLDWIFTNGEEVFNKANGVTVIALARCLGLTENDLWGPSGEGYHFHKIGGYILQHAKPFLEKKDKTGWLGYAAELKSRMRNA